MLEMAGSQKESVSGAVEVEEMAVDVTVAVVVCDVNVDKVVEDVFGTEVVVTSDT